MEEKSECILCGIFNDILSVIALLFMIFGTLGNLFASYICLRPSLQKVHTFRIMSILFLHEIFSLYTWNLDIFLLLFWSDAKGASLNLDQISVIESLSIETCRIFTFMQYYSLQCISWLMVFVSADQCVKLYFPTWMYSRKTKYVYPICLVRIKLFSKHFIINLSIVINDLSILTFLNLKGICVFLFILNGHILIFGGTLVNFSENVTTIGFNDTRIISKEVIECYDSDLYEFYPFWHYFHSYIYAIGPFCIMIIMNIFLATKLFGNTLNANRTNQNRKKKLVITILITSFLFIITALTEVIPFAYFYDELASTYLGSVILNACDIVNFTWIASNFALYFITNNVFRNECISQIKLIGIVLSFWFCKPFVSQTKFAQIREKYNNRNNRFYSNNKKL